jgi:hypothetical protein
MCRSCDATVAADIAGGGSAPCPGVQPTAGQHPARRDSSEPSTSTCRSCDATAPAPMADDGSALGGPRSGRARRDAIAASRARPRAARATQPPPLTTAGGRSVPGSPRVGCDLRVKVAASRARPRDARVTRPPRPALAGGGSAPGGPRLGRIRRDAIAASRRAARAPRPPAVRRRHGWRRICAGQPRCGPHPARRYRSEPSTSTYRPCAATATASTALSADSALAAYSACAVTRIAVGSDSSSSVMASLAPPAPAARARPGPGGRVRPAAADGRAVPFRFRKELYRSSRNGTSPEGTRDSGRTFVLSGRKGPARPSAAGRTRPPGLSRPWHRAGSGWNQPRAIQPEPLSLSQRRYAEPVCSADSPRAARACSRGAPPPPRVHGGGGIATRPPLTRRPVRSAH